jgi:hypothetical protein
MSDVVFGKEYASDQLFKKGTIGRYVGKTLEFVGRTSLDILTDPVSWIYPAATGTTRLIMDASGNVVRTGKTGLQIAKGLAEGRMTQLAGKTELGIAQRETQKLAQQELATIITGEKSALEAGKTYNVSNDSVSKVLKLMGIETTPENISKAISEGLPQLRARRALKLVSPVGSWQKDLFTWDRMRPAYEKVAAGANKWFSKLPLGQEILDAEKSIAQSVKDTAFKIFRIGRPE